MKITYRIFIIWFVACSGLFGACNYLDVVPDNIATIDDAFTTRSMAEKYLFTCYSYMPAHADINSQAFLTGDEFWVLYPQSPTFFYNDPFEQIARGNQAVVSPSLNYWDGLNGGKPMFVALRDCNIFLEKMNNSIIPGLIAFDQKQWIAEVKFLKAYYHYWLLRMYGPIPLIRENLPVSASIEEVQVKREPVDDCFDYIVSLLDEAIPDLPLMLKNETTEIGRITKPIALAVKAKVLVEAASPLFNGNTDYASFKRKGDGVQYFNPTYDVKKWEKAAVACRNAIDTCHLAKFALFEYVLVPGESLSPELVTQMSIRNSVTDNNYNYNKESVWLNPNSTSNRLQRETTARVDPSCSGNAFYSNLAPPMKIAEMFYTEHGVPIEEDEDWDVNGKYLGRYNVKTITNSYRYNLAVGMETATLNFDREIRFYANLGFDGGLWYGLGKFDANNQHILKAKNGEYGGNSYSGVNYSVTGYFCKKLTWYRNVIVPGTPGSYTIVDYLWPVFRLSDLYLLYSEALNEANGPSQEAYEWIDLVRKRAGLEGVVNSWSKYVKTSLKGKPTTKEGFREIIQRERLIELANEGHRYWDIRRWKKGREMWNNQPIQGWDVLQENTDTYYRVRTIFTPKFTTKDYFWPIREYNLSVNLNLDQNPGW